MKRNHLSIGLFLAFAAVVVAACISPLAPEDKPVRPGSDGYALELSLNCMRTATKVTIPGEAKYNENKLTHIDWFVFTSNSNDAVSVLHGRESWTDKDDVTERFLAKTVAMDDYVSTYGNAGNASGYVLVVANLPDTHDELSVKTIAELRSVPVTAVFDNYHLKDPTDYTSAVFDPQDSFTMLSGLLPFTLTVEEPVDDVFALMKRTASKVTLKINLARAIDEVNAIMEGRDTVRVEYLQTWYPDTSNIQIYMSYANSKSTLDGTPLSYNQQNFFSYNRYSYHYNIEPSAERDHVDYDVHEAVLYHKVEGTPFYSFPITWNISDANAPFIKIIIPWDAYKETVTMDRAHNYLWHDGEELKYRPGDTLKVVTRNHLPANFETSQDFYYKISIPDEDELMRSNYWYRISLDVAILGSRDDDLSTELSGHYYVMDWADPHQSSGGVLTQGRYLGVPSHEYTMNNIESITVPVNSSHALSATVLSKEIYRPNNSGVWGWQNNAARTTQVTTTGRSSFTFTDDLEPEMGSSLDCFMMRYTVRVYHTDDSNYYEDVVIYQYPAIYLNYKVGKPSFVDGYYGNVNGYYATPNTGTYAPTFNINQNEPTYSGNGITAVFDNSTYGGNGNNRRYTMGVSNNSPGTITITAEAGMTITGITLGYYQNRNAQAVTFNGVNTGSKTNWTGSESEVVVSMAYTATANSRNVVNSLSVTYRTDSPATTGTSGNTGSYNATPYGNITQQPDNQFNITVINISAFGPNSHSYTVNLNGTTTTRDYIIADPREPAGYTSDDLVPYYDGNGAAVEWGDDAEAILCGTTTNPNFIAPKFMVASKWGRQESGNTSYENTLKRCATYQEAGYPAGRWRLPTEAEVMFIMNMQRYGFIETLFNTTARYWISDGNSIQGNGTNVTVSSTQDGQSSRCVYDLWYWGETPMTPTDEYHIAP